MATVDQDQGRGIHATNRRGFMVGAVAAVGAAIAYGAHELTNKPVIAKAPEAPQPKPATVEPTVPAQVVVEPATPAATATHGPDATATNIPDTATATIIADSPTAVKTAIPVAISTPKVEASPTPIKKLEQVLGGNYSVFSNGKDLVIADLPGINPTDSHGVFMFEGVSGGIGPEVLDWNVTGDNSFNATHEIGYKNAPAEVGILEGIRNPAKNSISIALKMGDNTNPIVKELTQRGTGLKALLAACKEVKTIVENLGSNGFISDEKMQSEINFDLRERYNRLPAKSIPQLH